MWTKHKIAFLFLDCISFLFPKHSPEQGEKSSHFFIFELSFNKSLLRGWLLLYRPHVMKEPNKANVETLLERKLLSSSSAFLLELITWDSMCSCCERTTQLGCIVRHEKSGILKAAKRPRVCYSPYDQLESF